MNTYNGFNLRHSVTAAFLSVVAVTFSVLFSASCMVGTVGPAGTAQAYTIVAPQA